MNETALGTITHGCMGYAIGPMFYYDPSLSASCNMVHGSLGLARHMPQMEVFIRIVLSSDRCDVLDPQSGYPHTKVALIF